MKNILIVHSNFKKARNNFIKNISKTSSNVNFVDMIITLDEYRVFFTYINSKEDCYKLLAYKFDLISYAPKINKEYIKYINAHCLR